jgi:hypothetical protein
MLSLGSSLHRGNLVADLAEEEKRWDTLASVNDYKCESCGQKIPYGEREIYFERKLCGYCAHLIKKKH